MHAPCRHADPRGGVPWADLSTPSLVLYIESHSPFPGSGKEGVSKCDSKGDPSPQNTEEQGLTVPVQLITHFTTDVLYGQYLVGYLNFTF